MDDHALFRAGIRALLENLAGVQVIAEAGDGREALRLVETHQPHLVLMDIGMTGLNSLEATAPNAKEFPIVSHIVINVTKFDDTCHYL